MAPDKKYHKNKSKKPDARKADNKSASKSPPKNAKNTSKTTKKEDKPTSSTFYKAIPASERKQACLYLLSKEQIRKLEPEFCQQTLCDTIMGPIKRDNGSLDEKTAAFPIFHGLKLNDTDCNTLPQANTVG